MPDVKISSQNTYLMSGTPFALLVDIKDYPDSGSEPEQIQTTDLSQLVNHTYIRGLQDLGSLPFTVNYTQENLEALTTAKAAGEQPYAVYFGPAAEFGGYKWTGTLDFWHAGKGINEVKELMVSFTVSSTIENLPYLPTP